jgi:hypothetical protein
MTMLRDDYQPVVDALLDAGLVEEQLLRAGTGRLPCGVGYSRRSAGMDVYVIGPKDAEANGLLHADWTVAVAFATGEDTYSLQWATGLPVDEAVVVMLLCGIAPTVEEALNSLGLAAAGEGFAAL